MSSKTRLRASMKRLRFSRNPMTVSRIFRKSLRRPRNSCKVIPTCRHYKTRLPKCKSKSEITTISPTIWGPNLKPRPLTWHLSNSRRVNKWCLKMLFSCLSRSTLWNKRVVLMASCPPKKASRTKKKSWMYSKTATKIWEWPSLSIKVDWRSRSTAMREI